MPFDFSPLIETHQKDTYFAAMNSPDGFVSAFDTLFSPYRRYLIKGGPGTGKSTLMKKLAQKASQQGLSVKRYLCSSDTASLDAVVIPEKHLALIDATRPHATEPHLVGAWDHYVDLSRFLREDKLAEHTETLDALDKAKKNSYRAAYHTLAAIREIDLALETERREAFLFDKCEKAMIALLARFKLHEEKNPHEAMLPISAIGTSGYRALDTPTQQAITVYFRNSRGCARYLLETIARLLREKQISFFYSLSPLTMTPDTLILEKAGIVFTSLPLKDSPEITVNTERFLLLRGKGLLKDRKTTLKAANALCIETCDHLRRAGIYHSETETYYRAAMDFDALSRYTEAFTDSLLG